MNSPNSNFLHHPEHPYTMNNPVCLSWEWKITLNNPTDSSWLLEIAMNNPSSWAVKASLDRLEDIFNTMEEIGELASEIYLAGQ